MIIKKEADKLYELTGCKELISDNEVKKCLVKNAIDKLSNSDVWLNGYYKGEICCDAKHKYASLIASDLDKFKSAMGSSLRLCFEKSYMLKISDEKISLFDSEEEILNNPCSLLSGGGECVNCKPMSCTSDKVWKDDDDLSKNSCNFYEPPAHSSIILGTGTCTDYSVVLTTILRNLGLNDSEVYTVVNYKIGHAYNIVKFPDDVKYTIVDTTGNNPNSMIDTKALAQGRIKYCSYKDDYDNFCVNDLGKYLCPDVKNVKGCEDYVKV